jgi:hypothetical protein
MCTDDLLGEKGGERPCFAIREELVLLVSRPSTLWLAHRHPIGWVATHDATGLTLTRSTASASPVLRWCRTTVALEVEAVEERAERAGDGTDGCDRPKLKR